MTKKQRAQAAKKGWKTRRANERKAELARQRAKARRSEAQKRAWVRRHEKEARRQFRAREKAERVHAARREQARLHKLREPDLDYFEELSEDFDIDVSDLYDMYYGYEPRGVA